MSKLRLIFKPGCGFYPEWTDMRTYRVIGPNFVAGAIVDDHDRIVKAAPILRRYQSLIELFSIAHLRDWKIEQI